MNGKMAMFQRLFHRQEVAMEKKSDKRKQVLYMQGPTAKTTQS